MKFKEVRSNTIPVKAYSKIIYVDFDNVSTQIVNVLKALCDKEKDNVLLIFASLHHRTTSVSGFLESVKSHYYGWIFNKNHNSPDLVDHALAALQVKFMMELGEHVTKPTHVLLSADKKLAVSIKNNLAFAGVDTLAIIKNSVFQPDSKEQLLPKRGCFPEALYKVMIGLNKDKINLSDLGELIKPPEGKLKQALLNLGIFVKSYEGNTYVQVQKTIKVLSKSN